MSIFVFEPQKIELKIEPFFISILCNPIKSTFNGIIHTVEDIVK